MPLRGAITSVVRGVAWIVAARSSSAAFAHTLTARLLLTCLNFGTGVLVARTLEAHGRGVQAAISIWPVVLSGIFTLGIPSALRFRIPREPRRAAELLSVSLAFALILGGVAILVGFLFVPHWLSKYSADDVRFAQLMLLFIPGAIGLYMIGAFLEATGRFQQSNALSYAPPASTLIALVVLASIHRLTPFTSTLAYFIPTNILFIIRLYSLRSDLRIRWSTVRSSAALLTSYGVRAFGIDVLNVLSTQVDQALVVRFLSASQLGIYTVALAVSRLLGHLATALTTVLLPKAAGLPKSDALILVSRAARLTFGVTACGAIVLATIAPTMVSLFYGRDFEQAGRLAQVLCVEATLGATISVLAQAFLSTGRPGVVAVLQGIGLAAIVPFMVYAIPRFGLLGAALALLGSTTLRFVFVLGCFPVLLRVAPPSVVPTPADARFAIGRMRGLSSSGSNDR